MNKVLAAWQWYNWLRQNVASTGKRCVTINLDESPVPATYLGMKGNVVARVGHHLFTDRCHSRTDSAVTRQYFTLVMMVCDDDAIQRVLPQLIIVGKKLLSWADFRMTQSWLPDNVFIKRRDGTGWNSAELFVELLSLLDVVLEPFKATTRFIFMCDAVPLHTETSVLAALTTLRDHFWFILIPAKVTWLLQPLDVGVFSILKRELRRRYAIASITDCTEKELLRMIRLLSVVVREVTRRSSKKVFRKTGFWHSQAFTSKYILRQLNMTDPPVVLPLQPDDAALKLFWPRNRRITFAAIAGTQPGSSGVPAAILGDLASPPAVADEVVHMLPGGAHLLGLPHSMPAADDELYEPESPIVPAADDLDVHHLGAAIAASSFPAASSSSAMALAPRRRCSFKQPD